jgi:hypothetical protein
VCWSREIPHGMKLPSKFSSLLGGRLAFQREMRSVRWENKTPGKGSIFRTIKISTGMTGHTLKDRLGWCEPRSSFQKDPDFEKNPGLGTPIEQPGNSFHMFSDSFRHVNPTGIDTSVNFG